jgi:hypothetical protein
VPWVSKHVAPLFVEFSSGYTVLAGGIVLSVMIIPLLVSLFMEIFDNISTDLREASLSLGASKRLYSLNRRYGRCVRSWRSARKKFCERQRKTVLHLYAKHAGNPNRLSRA